MQQNGTKKTESVSCTKKMAYVWMKIPQTLSVYLLKIQIYVQAYAKVCPKAHGLQTLKKQSFLFWNLSNKLD